MTYPKTLNKKEMLVFLEETPLRMIVTQISEKTIIIQKLSNEELSLETIKENK